MTSSIDNTSNNINMRVKLYQLESEGSWLDRGTGHVICKYVSSIEAPALIMYNEDDIDNVIIQSRIQLEDIYERQGGNSHSFFIFVFQNNE